MQRLTKKFIDSVAAPGAEAVYWDSDLATHSEFRIEMPAIEAWEGEFEVVEGVDRGGS